MNNFALGENGAEVMMATANDDNFPSENMLDGKEDTFWTTTGLFPHEVVIKLAKRESISKVMLCSTSVRKLVVEKCDGETPDRFEKVLEVELANRKGLQKEMHSAEFKAKWVKFILVSGWDSFAAVSKVSLE